MKRKVSIIMIFVCLFSVCAIPAYSQEEEPQIQDVRIDKEYMRGERPSGEAMIADATVGRFVGIASMIVGMAGFIISLPFAATSDSVQEAGEALIVEPGQWTFQRKLGDF